MSQARNYLSHCIAKTAVLLLMLHRLEFARAWYSTVDIALQDTGTHAMLCCMQLYTVLRRNIPEAIGCSNTPEVFSPLLR